MFNEHISEKFREVAVEIGSVRVALVQKKENELAAKLFEVMSVLAEINKLDAEVKAKIGKIMDRF